ncbi:MAG: trigger factor [Deltaproteobacteria bacterium]|nr:trigger factor [Deltaproteobacteria bacterium]
MQVTVVDISSVKKVLHIEIPNDAVVKELNTAYNSVRKNAKIKGFRPGKAPRTVLERLYKKDVHADVSSRLIQTAFVEAIQKESLGVLGQPKIDPPEIDPAAAYCFDATVEIKPEIDDIEFKGMGLKKTVYPVTDEALDNHLSMLQNNLAKKVPIETKRAVQANDFVLIDYEGFKDGAAFSETQKTDDFMMKIGTGAILEAFDNEVVGMMPGENKTFPVTFPADYHNKNLANIDITFDVSLKEIRKEELPEIDDELAKQVGEYETLDALKAAIRDNLIQGYEKRTEQELNEQVFSTLLEKTDFEVPDTLVDFELQHIVQDAQKSFAQHNISMEDAGISEDQLKGKYRETAEKQARRHLILTKIIDQESLELSDDELDAGIKDMADAYNQPFDQFKTFFLSQNEQLAYFKETLLEKKAIKLILENGDIEEVAAEKEDAQPKTD